MGKEFILKMREHDKEKAKKLIWEILKTFNKDKNSPKEFLEENLMKIKNIGLLYSINISATYDNDSLTIYFDDKPVLRNI